MRQRPRKMYNKFCSSQIYGHAAMLLFSALVAGSFSLGSLVANEIAPIALTAVRFMIAAIVIGLAAFMLKKISRQALEAPWRYFILGGLLSIYFVLMFEGLKTAPPVSVAAVFTLTPVIAGLFGFVLLRQIVTVRTAVALTIGAVGALWVIFRADLAAILQFRVGRGEVIYFWGCVAHALYTPMIVRLNRGEPAIVFTLGTIVSGGLLLTILGWSDIRSTDWYNLPKIVWITLVYVSIFASAVTFLLLQFASFRLPAAKVMAYTYLVPSWVILWEVSIGHAAPRTIVVLGVAITLVALWMLLRNDETCLPTKRTDPQLR